MMARHRSERVSRRESLRVGSIGFGLTLPRLLAADSNETQGRPKAKARSVVILYLSGGPSQLDTWDMKPNAPVEIRGTFEPIATNVVGTHVCEHLPRMATLADKYAIVRSMSHDDADHLKAGYWVMTGSPLLRPVAQKSGMQRDDRPHIGSVVSRFLDGSAHVPPFVTVPEFVSPVGVARPGQYAGFLGPTYDPYLIDSDPNEPDFTPGPVAPRSGNSAPRRSGRRSLLRELERGEQRRSIDGIAVYEAYREKAFDLVGSSAARDAFRIDDESERTKDRYGRHVFGQSTLIARRLVEAGVRLVQVNFPRHDNGKWGQGYDSHSVPPSPPHLPWCRDELFGPTDAAFASLIEDLSERGLLDETLVLMMGEFGRTPRFNANAGRDHWSRCYSLIMAGGGIVGGRVHGASDRIAAFPTTEPVTPQDILATVYHQLGIDHETRIHDPLGRPHVIADGRPVLGLL